MPAPVGRPGGDGPLGGGLPRGRGALEDCLVLSSFSLDWWWYPAILAIALAGGLILGAFIQRFGSKGGWIIWSIWMVVCLGPQFFGKQAMLIGDWNQYMIAAGGLLAIACLIWSVWSLLHAVVKG